MKIRVSMMVDVDPTTWAATYGEGLRANGRVDVDKLRDNVRSYVVGGVSDSAAALEGAIRNVELRIV